MNNFKEANERSHSLENVYLKHFYAKIFFKYSFAQGDDALSIALQRREGCDAVGLIGHKYRYVIKYLQHKFPEHRPGRMPSETPNLAIEVVKNGSKRGAWGRAMHADYLVVGYERPSNTMDLYMFEWHPFKKWFFEHEEEFPLKENSYRIVSMSRIEAIVPVGYYKITQSGQVDTIRPLYGF